MDMAAMVIDPHLIHYDDIWPLCEQYVLYITTAEILCWLLFAMETRVGNTLNNKSVYKTSIGV